MALTTTSGDAAADSYGSLVEFQTYAQTIGFDLSGFTDTDDGDQEVAMRKAVHYLDRAYMSLYIGFRSSKTQALEWPRRSFRDDAWQSSDITTGFTTLTDNSGFEIESDEIPERLKTAQFEAAFLSLGGTDLNPSIDRGSLVQSETVKAGPVSSATTFNNTSGASARARFLTIEGLLEGLSNGTPGGGMGGGRVVRG